MINFKKARELSSRGNVVPVFEKIPADLDTPVSAFMKLAADKKESFLLESIEGGEKLARYSFLGFDPYLVVESSGDNLTVRRGRNIRNVSEKPIPFIRNLFKKYRPVKVPGLPRFTGGGVGYFAYDTIRWVEKIPDNNNDTIGLPDMRLSLYSHIIAFDHLKQEILVIANLVTGDSQKTLRQQYDEATRWIRQSVRKLTMPLPLSARKNDNKKAGKVIAHTSKQTFVNNVRKAKRYIKEGDIYQVVLSQRWEIKSNSSALNVYRRLRRINPSPYMFLLNFGNNAVVGSSPEMMVRIEKDIIETRPIAGTRPRGKNEAEDARLIADLLADKKELSEHTMLLDLGRNDVGRVSKTATVKVKDNMIIEKYSHVIHIVSSVVGEINRKHKPIDGHFACFPAGTVSGAPKIRAMEIIDELETERRGIYAGSIAYLDFWGNLDSCIAIRTLVKKGNKYYIQAGAGIVADSKPSREFSETESKARAAIQAVTGEN